MDEEDSVGEMEKASTARAEATVNRCLRLCDPGPSEPVT